MVNLFPKIKTLGAVAVLMVLGGCGGSFSYDTLRSVETVCVENCEPPIPKMDDLRVDDFQFLDPRGLYLTPTPSFSWVSPDPSYFYTAIVSEEESCASKIDQVHSGLKATQLVLRPLANESQYYLCMQVTDENKRSARLKPLAFKHVLARQLQASRSLLSGPAGKDVELEDFQVRVLDKNGSVIPGESGLKLGLSLAAEGIQIKGKEASLRDGVASFSGLRLESETDLSGAYTLTARLVGLPDSLNTTIQIQLSSP